MTKAPIPLSVADLSAFARALARQLGDTAPSHLTLMNMLARAGGFENLQHLRATQAAGRRLNTAAAPAVPDARPDAPPDARQVERVLNQFDTAGRLIQWPAKRSTQTLALWVLWSALPRGGMTEKTINAALNAQTVFNDAATLRRTMISCGLLSRAPGSTDYTRVESPPPPEARVLITQITQRRIDQGAPDV